MDDVWELDRIELLNLMKKHPQWSIARLAQTLNRSQSWVKKWRKRIREAQHITRDTFKSRSHAPKTRPKRVSKRVCMAILSFRDQLQSVYNRVVGPKTILYHLHIDPLLKDEYLPRSSYTVWGILKAGGRIPTRVREHHPVERPAPMCHWELDFGQVKDNYVAFPHLPKLPELPHEVNPDAWLRYYDNRIFKRKLSDNGATPIDRYGYRVGYEYANKTVGFQLDADMACFYVICDGKRVKEFEIQGLYGQSLSMTDYLVNMLEEARNIKDEV